MVKEKRRQEIMQTTRTPDYSWLMDWKLKSKKNLGFRVSVLDKSLNEFMCLKECAAIEMMCRKIRPNEWSSLIRLVLYLFA